MKKSFRSLRHSRKHDEGSSEDSIGMRQRTQSDIVLMNREDPSIYPGWNYVDIVVINREDPSIYLRRLEL